MQGELRQVTGIKEDNWKCRIIKRQSSDIAWALCKNIKTEHLESYYGLPHAKFGVPTFAKMHWSSTYGNTERFKLSWNKNTLTFY